MKVVLDIRKSVDENAASYFELAKRDKRKIEGAQKTIADYRARIERSAEEAEKEQQKPKAAKRKPEWYEKFRWFFSSDGFLVIGGRDATTNEIVIKKHAEPHDIVFHTDMAGSPFVVVKTEKKEVSRQTLEEAAQFTAAFSKGWKNGMATLPVFSCRPEQVSKTPNPGEFIAKGSFIIRGELTYYSPRMEYAVGSYSGTVMGGPTSAVRKHCEKLIEISQGDAKISDVAKAIKNVLGGELDEIMRVLPAGCKLKKV